MLRNVRDVVKCHNTHRNQPKRQSVVNARKRDISLQSADHLKEWKLQWRVTPKMTWPSSGQLTQKEEKRNG